MFLIEVDLLWQPNFWCPMEMQGRPKVARLVQRLGAARMVWQNSAELASRSGARLLRWVVQGQHLLLGRRVVVL